MKKTVAVFLAMILFFAIKSEGILAKDVQTPLRGVWVATVLNIDYPKEGTTDSQELKAQAIKILDDVQRMNMNAVFLQVRPTADAFYKSDLFSYSKYLTGNRELAPDGGFDTLKFWVDEAHARGIELHAWINPYRITKNEKGKPHETLDNLPKNHIARLNSQYVVKHGDDLYFDPAIPEVRTLIASGVEEILKSYDVDGIHFDDYFYPSNSFNDATSYQKYGVNQSLKDFRINNVNLMIQEVHKVTQKYKKPFGIAPFGIWKNKSSDPLGSNTKGGETYTMHYADCRAWVKNGWIDYIMPQIYWEFGHSAADYQTLVEWWNDVVGGTQVKLYIGHAAYKATQTDVNDKWYGGNQIIRQIEYSLGKPNVSGNVFFSYRSFKNNPILQEEISTYYRNKNNVNAGSTNPPKSEISNGNAGGNTNTNTAANVNANSSSNVDAKDPKGKNPSASLNKKMPTSNEIMGFRTILKMTSHEKISNVSTPNVLLEGDYDVNAPLLLNGKQVLTKILGKFKVPVTLKVGENCFVFQNGVQSFTKYLYYHPQDAILSDAYPNDSVMLNGAEFTLSCKALAGSEVTAIVGGKSYQLEPTKAVDFNKIKLEKIEYSKKVNFSDFDHLDLGQVQYKVKTAIFQNSFFSNGSIINLKNDSHYYAMVQDDDVDVYFKNDSSKGSAHLLDKGDIDKILYMSGRYAKMSSGYWIKRSNISWFHSVNPLSNSISYLGMTQQGDWKEIKFLSSMQSAVYLDYTNQDKLRLYVPLGKELPELPHFPESFRLAEVRRVNERIPFYEFTFSTLLDGYFIKKNADGFSLFIRPHVKSADFNYPLKDKIVVIDPGHGGSDSGTKGHRPDIIMEKDYTLQTSIRLRRILENLGATVYMTRVEDEDVYMHDRLRSSKKIGADLFLSIHANAVGSKRAPVVKGFSAYIQNANNLTLAKSIRDRMVNNLNMNDMKVHFDDFYVTRGTWGLYMLLEMGFLTHPEEYKELANPEFQEKQASEIAAAIAEYFRK